jgi:hypothetical protein
MLTLASPPLLSTLKTLQIGQMLCAFTADLDRLGAPPPSKLANHSTAQLRQPAWQPTLKVPDLGLHMGRVIEAGVRALSQSPLEMLRMAEMTDWGESGQLGLDEREEKGRKRGGRREV